MAAVSGSDQEKLEQLCSKNYQEQAIWFLNAFFNEISEKGELEKIWQFKHKFDQLDLAKGKEGNELDELNAHRFLEAFKDPLTVKEMRDKLRAKGALREKGVSKYVPLTHYLVVHYDADFHKLVTAPQGNPEEVKEAQRRLEEVNKALQECEKRATECREALNAARSAAIEAKNREDEAKKAAAQAKKQEEAALLAEAAAKAQEAAAKRAEEEARHMEAEAVERAKEAAQRQEDLAAAQRDLEAALAEVKKEEDAYNARTAELKKKSEEGGTVQRGKAANELAQHLSQETLPLKKAKITAEAAVKRAEKATAAAAHAKSLSEAAARDAREAREGAEAATRKASAARAEAERAAAAATAAREAAEEASRQASEARQRAEEAERRSQAAKEAADAQVEATKVKFQEAEAYLEEVKNSMGLGAGWWLDRELNEKRKYLPVSKGGTR